MKHRHVFSTADFASAQRAVNAARALGIGDDNIALVARSNIEMDQIPNERLDASTDTIPAALRGAGVCGALGLGAGVIGVAVPAFGLSIAGAGLLTLVGAAVGGWSGALAGSATPNSVRRAFDSEIEHGRILVVIDDVNARAVQLHDAMDLVGATQLPYEHVSAFV